MHKNRLSEENSPYLLQHAHNPVDWYPWGEEAFEKARREDKLIFLSIGYSTCHWCHVMERESFENDRVAALMNDAFVSIKVDREERPDIDNIYMAVCQAMTGSGGWPLTIVMTPDREPFFAATYIPRDTRFGRTGMLELIPQLKDVWQQRRQDVLASAGQITGFIRQAKSAPAGEAPDVSLLEEAYRQLSMAFDPVHGGFGHAPKFPTPHQYVFLLRYWSRTGSGHALEMVEKSLDAMRLGGIYDHVGHGFHRYSTDPYWLVPHFEKMLYDQALLALAFTELFQATGKQEHAQTVREILAYVLRDMTDPEGGFYSAEDADSEGVEGKFYLWTENEIDKLLAPEEAALIKQMYSMQPEGNFPETEGGANILHASEPLTAEALVRIEPARRKLFEAREKRVHPGKDDKILTDWNGLMIAALARAGQVLEDPQYTAAAARSGEFLLSRMRAPDGGLLHRYRGGQAAIPGNVDDYQFLIWGCIELYEALFDPRHLRLALELNEYAVAHFWDSQAGGFFFTADNAEQLLIRQKETYDGAVPSGNSVALLNLLRLARLTGNSELEEKASLLTRLFSQAAANPTAFAQFLAGLDFAAGPSFEVVIVGEPGASDSNKMLEALRRIYLPRKVVLFKPANQQQAAITELSRYTAAMKSADGKATAYVCQNYACSAPTTDVDPMLQALRLK